MLRPANVCLIVFLVALGGCVGGAPAAPGGDGDAARAVRLAQDALIVDTHIDMPYRLQEADADIIGGAPDRDFDLPRARRGGLDVAFMSIYIPAEREADGSAGALADELIDMVEGIVQRSGGRIALAASTADVERQHAAGVLSFALGMENGAPVAGDLARLDHYYERGIRYITLTHSKSNHISDSSYDEERPWGGLSPFGERLVVAMNRRGVMVDVSHVSDEAFYDVLRVAKAPPIASHSSARHFTPGFERNMDDAMIVALAAAGGVIQINFGSTFLNARSRQSYDELKQARTAYLENNGFAPDGDEHDAFTAAYRERVPFHFATLDDVLDHIDHVRDLVGIDHVGLGSDFDGVGDSLPTGLKDVAAYPALVAGLLERGYSERDIRKVLGGNLLRVWREVERYAASHRDR